MSEPPIVTDWALFIRLLLAEGEHDESFRDRVLAAYAASGIERPTAEKDAPLPRVLVACPDCDGGAYVPGDCATCGGLRVVDVRSDHPLARVLPPDESCPDLWPNGAHLDPPTGDCTCVIPPVVTEEES